MPHPLQTCSLPLILTPGCLIYSLVDTDRLSHLTGSVFGVHFGRRGLRLPPIPLLARCRSRFRSLERYFTRIVFMLGIDRHRNEWWIWMRGSWGLWHTRMPFIVHVVYWKSDALLTSPSMAQVEEGADTDANDGKGDANSNTHFGCRIAAAAIAAAVTGSNRRRWWRWGHQTISRGRHRSCCCAGFSLNWCTNKESRRRGRDRNRRYGTRWSGWCYRWIRRKCFGDRSASANWVVSSLGLTWRSRRSCRDFQAEVAHKHIQDLIDCSVRIGAALGLDVCWNNARKLARAVGTDKSNWGRLLRRHHHSRFPCLSRWY